MTITRRSLLKAIGIAPAVAAGVVAVEPVEAELTWELYGDFVPREAELAWIETPRFDMAMPSFAKYVHYYNADGVLTRYRITTLGVESLGPVT